MDDLEVMCRWILSEIEDMPEVGVLDDPNATLEEQMKAADVLLPVILDLLQPEERDPGAEVH